MFVRPSPEIVRLAATVVLVPALVACASAFAPGDLAFHARGTGAWWPLFFAAAPLLAATLQRFGPSAGMARALAAAVAGALLPLALLTAQVSLEAWREDGGTFVGSARGLSLPVYLLLGPLLVGLAFAPTLIVATSTVALDPRALACATLPCGAVGGALVAQLLDNRECVWLRSAPHGPFALFGALVGTIVAAGVAESVRLAVRPTRRGPYTATPACVALAGVFVVLAFVAPLAREALRAREAQIFRCILVQ